MGETSVSPASQRPTPAEVQPPLRVKVSSVSKRFGTKRGEVLALDNVSLEVAENERVVLLGPSGCGKTTLLRCIAGLEVPDDGEIEIGGEIVFSARKGISIPPEKRDLSMMFQSYALWPHMSVARNISFPLQSLGITKKAIAERVEAALSMVACDGLGGRFPAQLSGGQQQRVALARAIVANDSVILFDEPLSNVDAKVREQLRVELVALQRQLGFSALYVTHDQSEAAAMADRIAVFENGRLAQVGAPREIYQSPNNAYVASFMGFTNQITGRVIELQGDRCVVQTEIGPICGHNRDSLDLMMPARLFIRPEHIGIARPDVLDKVNHPEAVVEAEMFLGHSAEYAVTAGKCRLVLRTNSSEIFPAGADVRLNFDADHVQVYQDA